MLISPKNFIKRYENASLDEIYKVKNSIMKFIIEYESGKYDEIDHLRCPSYSSQYNNDKKILVGLNKLIEIKKRETRINDNNHLVDDLEKIVNMYKEGLLTDEEFAAMKKKLIDG